MQHNPTITKKNVSTFNEDVAENGGYRYTTHAQLSSRLANKRIGDAVLNLLRSISPMQSIIDIGCGDGIYTQEIKDAFPNTLIEGNDPAADAIAHAVRSYPDITFRVENILDDSIDVSKQYDVGIVRGVLHHLSDQEKAFKNSFRLSDTLIIIEPNGNNPIVKLFEKFSPYHREHEEQSFTTTQLTRWCERAGGTVVKTDYIGFVPFFFPMILVRIIYPFQPLLERIPLVRKYLSGQIVLLCKKDKQ